MFIPIVSVPQMRRLKICERGDNKRVLRVGDVMCDALLHNLKVARGKSQIQKKLDLKKGRVRAGNRSPRRKHG